MKTIKTPNGIITNVPEHIEEDVSRRFSLNEVKEALDYYSYNGYVIFKNMFSVEDIDEVNYHWDSEIKGSNRYIYRQATAKAEKHVKNDVGWIMNPILNLQSLNIKDFGKFRFSAERKIFTKREFVHTMRQFLDDDPKIVQSMYFEGNSETWEHQDTFYLDSDQEHMIGTWIAMEDIAADAGRFFICVGSHNVKLEKQNLSTNIVDHHDKYKTRIVNLIRSNNLEMRAPYLCKGDVLFWHSRTIHGSLQSNNLLKSRRSITCHIIPNKESFVQLQNRVIETKTDNINGVYIYRPKNQARAYNRMILSLESTFPKSFAFLKGVAIKMMLALKG